MKTGIARKLLDVAAGVITAALVFAAVPIVLIALVGVPLPAVWDRAHIVSTRGLFDLLAIMAWVAWAACAWPLLVSVVTIVRGNHAGFSTTPRASERIAAQIAAAILVILPVGLTAGTAAASKPPTLLSATRPGISLPWTAPRAPAANNVGEHVPATRSKQPEAVTDYVVQPGDSLWSIAAHLYGDGGDWPLIASLNLGHVMVGGTRFMDPSSIYPGWRLEVPTQPLQAQPLQAQPLQVQPLQANSSTPPEADLGGLATNDTSTNSTTDGRVATSTQTSPRTALGPPQANLSTFPPSSLDALHVSISPTVAPTKTSVGSGSPIQRNEADPSTTPRRSPPSNPSGRSAPVPLPELVALGFGVVTASALARRLRKQRNRTSTDQFRDPLVPPRSERAIDAEILVDEFSNCPALDWLDTANRHLANCLLALPTTQNLPKIDVVRVGPDGVRALLSRKTDWAPHLWDLAEGGTQWHLSASNDVAAIESEVRDTQAWLPTLLPVGENDEGTWFLVAEPGTCIPIVGSEAETMIHTLELALASWSWADQITSTRDVLDVRREVQLATSTPEDSERSRTVFFGSPDQLSERCLAHCAVITLAPDRPTSMTVVATSDAVSLHPIGVTLRPLIANPQHLEGIEELLESAHRNDLGPALKHSESLNTSTSPGGLRDPATTVDPRRDRLQSVHIGTNDLSPGPVDVRLMTAIPRIDGLENEFPPNRERRSIELVAYLALHSPDPVTGDRLRTRVLGSSEADAAAKTLFNTATAARRALGLDEDGSAFLPPASKTGYYRISPLVTTDIGRFDRFLAAARQARSTTMTIDFLKGALGLIEGEPLGGVLSGYNWWHAEGHGARLEGVVVDTACELATLAGGSGRHDLARWALDQARRVAPFSESLTRSAMTLASLNDDNDRLEREWAACLRRADDLSPGSLPSEATEQLYVDLARRSTGNLATTNNQT
ncbi:MAG: LysM peptidoglycan-binding domain-containing protein [Acidimicrobiales bacterium]